MENKPIIFGVEKCISDEGEFASWNKKRIRWVIIHNKYSETKQHVIDLQMVILSSERIVKVDNQIKITSMETFGFQKEFQISKDLKGLIKQEGLTLNYELFINGRSFTHLSAINYSYQPPKIESAFESECKSSFNPSFATSLPSNQHSSTLRQSKELKIVKQIPIKGPTKSFKIQEPVNAFHEIKGAQNQLMKLLVEEKRKKKEKEGKQKEEKEKAINN